MSIFSKGKKPISKEVGVKVIEVNSDNIDEIGEIIAKEIKEHLKKPADNGKVRIALNGDSVTVDFPGTTSAEAAKCINNCTSVILNDIEEVVLNGMILTKMFNVDNRSLGDFIGEAMATYGKEYDEMSVDEFHKAVVRATDRNARIIKALCPDELKDFVCNVIDTLTKATEEAENTSDDPTEAPHCEGQKEEVQDE